MSREGTMYVKETTEKGDVAKSIQGMLKSQYQSRYWKDIYASTRLSRREILVLANMNVNRMIMQILSTSESDSKDSGLSDDEKAEHKQMYALKTRFMKNPTGLAYAMYDAFIYFYGLGLQSLDGLSRHEAMSIASGNIKRILDPSDMGTMDKMKRRLFGDVLFPE